MFRVKLEFIFIIFIICLAYLNINGFTDDSLYMFIVISMILIFYFKTNKLINGVSVFLADERDRSVTTLMNIFSEKNIILSNLISNEKCYLTENNNNDFVKKFNEYVFTYYSTLVSNVNELNKIIILKNQINLLIASINK
jgi:hypothetical protein